MEELRNRMAWRDWSPLKLLRLRKTLLPMVFLWALSIPTLAWSIDYYVDKNADPEGADGSYEHPWQTITHALSVAEDGDTVYVRFAESEYVESLVVPTGVDLIGIPQETQRPIIRSINVNTHAISLINYAGKIQGFAVTGAGNKNGINCAAENGGTNVAQIIDCDVYGNSMGIHAVTSAAEGDHCAPYIHRNVIHGNTTRGIGSMTYASPTIDGNFVFGNGNGSQDHGGIGNRDDSSATIVNNVIYENDRFGIAVRDRAAPKIANNTIIFHNASGGAAITVLQNEGISSVFIRNNVIADNERGLVSESGQSCTGNDYNDVWNSTLLGYLGFSPGSNDISRDPLFLDPGSRDFHLAWGSSCIDSGSPDQAPDWDIDGDARPQREGYDMGADEFFIRGMGEVILILEAVSGTNPTGTRDTWADPNHDGKIGLEDAAMILQEVSGLR
jgi:parallel beta-helix repeat protein